MSGMSINKEHARYLGSMFITVLTSQATMVVDAAVGGNLLGADAVSAVDLVMPVYELFYALVMMLGMGGCTVASMCLGRGDVGAVRRHFTAAVASSVCVMVLLGVGIVVFQDGAVRLLCGGMGLEGAPGQVGVSALQGGASALQGGASALPIYTRAYLVAMVPYFVLAGLSMIFMMFTSMAGRPGLMMWCAIVQFCVNVSCNLLLIKVVGMGIEALAYSSAFSCAVVLLLLLPYYLSEACPFRMVRCGLRELFSALGGNVRYGVGFLAVSVAYAVMAYSMNSLVLEHSGEQGLFFWSVVLMIYITGDYASSAAQETSLMLGGRLLGEGRKAEARRVYNRSLAFALGWIGLILVGIFALPGVVLPLFGAADTFLYPAVLRAVALAIPFIAGVSIANLFLVRLIPQGKIVAYIALSCLLYLAVPLVFFAQS